MSNSNKLIFSGIVASALLFMGTFNASANSLILDYGTNHSGVGGEFNAYSPTLNPIAMGYVAPAMVNANGLGLGFETFCLEVQEEFVPGGSYNYVIGPAAHNGGVSGMDGDPISLGTAWLYLNFSKGTLAGYSYSNSVDAGYLQDTIWWLEGEAASPGVSNPFADSVIAKFGDAAHAMADNNGFYGVGVLNLTYPNGALSQDQLCLVPDGGTTAMLMGLGLLGVFLVNRKLTRQHPVKA